MGKCIFCDIAIDSNSNELCNKCQCKFEKCEICGEYCLGEELSENGICDDCGYSNWCNN